MLKLSIGLFLGVLLLVSQANAQYARQELIAFESETMSVGDFLTGKKGTPVMLAGDLRLPKANEKNPVVIVMHSGAGQGGATDAVADWVRILNEAGFATFTIDSFTPRGILSFAETGRLSSLVRVVDAYPALALLSKHPLIDPDKIIVMGGSHGGTTALYSGMARFQKSHGSPDLKFAGHIVFYGFCATTYHDDEVLDQRPLLMLHGAADNAVPAAACRDYAARLAKAGTNVRFIEYPDAHHRFDSPNLQQPVNLPQVPSPVACRYAEADDGVIVNVATKQPPSRDDACLGKGVTFQYNEAAARKSHDDVLAFLKDVLAQK
jgi:dienelactone hydrolase